MIQQTRSQERGMQRVHGLLTCPRCGQLLSPVDHELGIAWRCLPCGGQSLNYSQFRRMVPEEGANDIWGTARDHPRVPTKRSRCPECLTGMSSVLVPLSGGMVELYICPPCQRLWLDRLDVGAQTAGALPPVEDSRARLQGIVKKLRGRPPVSPEAKERCARGLAAVEREYDKGLKRARDKRRLVFAVLMILWVLVRLLLEKFQR